MPADYSPRAREVAEDLMRTWAECRDCDEVRCDPSFKIFDDAAAQILFRFGMEWDVRHGYVFPWTNRETGPFPMTGRGGLVPEVLGRKVRSG